MLDTGPGMVYAVGGKRYGFVMRLSCGKFSILLGLEGTSVCGGSSYRFFALTFPHQPDSPLKIIFVWIFAPTGCYAGGMEQDWELITPFEVIARPCDRCGLEDECPCDPDEEWFDGPGVDP